MAAQRRATCRGAALLLAALLASPALAQMCPGGFFAWSGYCWVARNSGGGLAGPNANVWNPANVAVNTATSPPQLLVQVTASTASQRGYYSAEAVIDRPLGHGDYVFTIATDPALATAASPWLVAAPFIYSTDEEEIDMEFTKWGSPAASFTAQYVVQPSPAVAGAGDIYLNRFMLAGADTTHRIRWTPTEVSFESWSAAGVRLNFATADKGNRFWDPTRGVMRFNHWVSGNLSAISLPPVNTFAISCFHHCPVANLTTSRGCSTPLGTRPCCAALCPAPANGRGTCVWSAGSASSSCGVACNPGFVLQPDGISCTAAPVVPTAMRSKIKSLTKSCKASTKLCTCTAVVSVATVSSGTLLGGASVNTSWASTNLAAITPALASGVTAASGSAKGTVSFAATLPLASARGCVFGVTAVTKPTYAWDAAASQPTSATLTW